MKNWSEKTLSLSTLTTTPTVRITACSKTTAAVLPIHQSRVACLHTRCQHAIQWPLQLLWQKEDRLHQFGVNCLQNYCKKSICRVIVDTNHLLSILIQALPLGLIASNLDLISSFCQNYYLLMSVISETQQRHWNSEIPSCKRRFQTLAICLSPFLRCQGRRVSEMFLMTWKLETSE